MVHMTWTYNGIPGKRSRLRDAGLWMVDSPEYYNDGSFVTVDLNHPEVKLVVSAGCSTRLRRLVTPLALFLSCIDIFL